MQGLPQGCRDFLGCLHDEECEAMFGAVGKGPPAFCYEVHERFHAALPTRPARLAATPALRTGLAGSLSCMTLAAALVACDDAKGILDELLALCGDSTVDLSRWWADVPTEQATAIELDPVGGFIFLYWIDEDGAACHGEPGISGWPGPIVLPASDPRVLSMDSIPESMIAELQDIQFELGGYQASGAHLAQVAATRYRARGTGVVVKAPPYVFGAAAVVEPDRASFCLQPKVHVSNGSPECVFGGLFLPELDAPDGQHPSVCRLRAIPGGGTLSTEERRQFCVTDLHHGLRIHEP